jgi:hypothetical protein
MQKGEGYTWSVADSCVKWGSENGNIEQSFGFGEALDVLKMREGVDSRESPLWVNIIRINYLKFRRNVQHDLRKTNKVTRC